MLSMSVRRHTTLTNEQSDVFISHLKLIRYTSTSISVVQYLETLFSQVLVNIFCFPGTTVDFLQEMVMSEPFLRANI